MFTPDQLLNDAFARVHETLHDLLAGLPAETVLWQPDPAANSIGWLAWHLTRVQDDHVTGVVDGEQVWTSAGFADRFALPYDVTTVGYGQTADEVAQFHVGDVELLLAYHDAVHTETVAVIDSLDDAALARIVDERWNPPVTAAVRLVSVVSDTMQHLGQIGYLNGMAARRRP